MACGRLVLCSFAIQFVRRASGKMKWRLIEWKHIAESSRCCSASGMAAYRFAFFLVVLATDAMMVVQAGDTPLVGSWTVFATFTVWSWSLIGVYNLMAAFASLLAAMDRIPKGCVARVFCCSVWVLYEVMLPVSCLIFLLVWTVLLPLAYRTYHSDAGMLSLPSLAAHNLNFAFMLVETFLNKLCITTYHLFFMFYYGGIYVIFSWIFYYLYSFFFYFFIDWRYPFVLCGYTGLLGLLATFFFIGRGIVNCIKPALYTWELDLEHDVGTSDSSGSSDDD